jgi:hypothetical protein
MFLRGLRTAGDDGGHVKSNNDPGMNKAQDGSDAHGMAVHEPAPPGPGYEEHGPSYEVRAHASCPAVII